jgi:CRISPR-associated endonuclease Csn1
LDKTLESLGWPIIDLENEDPWFPWEARLQLLSAPIQDENRLYRLLSVVLRHMARHRGWRNPYLSVNSLLETQEPSKEWRVLVASIAKRLNRDAEELQPMTAAQVVGLARKLNYGVVREAVIDRATGEVTEQLFADVSRKLRGPAKVGDDGATRMGLFDSKIHQSDNVRELRSIFETQNLGVDLFRQVVSVVFQAKSPKGSARKRVAADALDKTQKRAEKASLAFQRYRIVNVLTNLRIQGDGSIRLLSPEEREKVLAFLWNPIDDSGKPIDEVTWDDVAGLLGVARSGLKGTATVTEDGDRPSARPPTNVTSTRILESKIKELVAEWCSGDEQYQEALIEMLSNGSGSGASQELSSKAEEFIAGLPEKVLSDLDKIKMPEGRAAYSVKTLRKLTERMLTTDDDLHAARKAIFDIPDNWTPIPAAIGEPVGNPAVDRVLKIVNRYLLSCEREWGVPLVVNIEHTRDGLMSEKQAREIEKENSARFKRNREMESEIAAYLNAQGVTVRSGGDDSYEENPDTPITGRAIGLRKRDIDRWRALVRQEHQCLYCGDSLEFVSFEMDHIVPRAGEGATNTQVNLAAVCRPCNHSKGRQPFASWASSGVRPQVSMEGAIARVDGFRFFGLEERDYRYQNRFKAEVKQRLRRTDLDEAIDSRSMESVGWMANELHHRINAHYQQRNKDSQAVTRVGVFRGWITSEARKAAGIEKKIMLIGGNPGKNRLDRRHHAVDAAVIAMIRSGAAQSLVVQQKVRDIGMDFDVAQVLAERASMHRQYELTTTEYANNHDERPRPAWTLYRGSNPKLFETWQEHMTSLADLIQARLESDEVPVFEFLRLSVGSSSAHEDTVRQTLKIRLGEELSVEMIDRSATPQQWAALTRHPDFDPKVGLLADPNRRIQIKGKWLDASDQIEFFPTGAGCIAVRGGYAELGSAFHHARIYRCVKTARSGKETIFFAMMRVYTVDLVAFRNCEDVFSVKLPPQSISVRSSEPRLREAFAFGQAEYVGWLVPGDELELDMSTQNSGAIHEFLGQFPGTTRWVVKGFFAQAKLHLQPRYLAGEGSVSVLTNRPAHDKRVSVSQSSFKILSGQGYTPSVNVVFNDCKATVIRRGVRGQVRTRSDSGLPMRWTACGGLESEGKGE